ncbi:polysaccharide deacetylase family protein [Shewanella saliphila]|uniref:Polysaccharide deacetylase n=1 Tax=Shewanella saliphila TaxID=2282698 RepID=A0ABQ2Q2M8_9GAMM|nr:polysaccharide deacetylase family protein [Shewanella saliphila]MCL1101050.1 polysaccharide deacetylase family protein [Shewanella saliphila]GGP44246.1 polysaccharide deacetylase [Shewanella saliphila]
MVKKIVLGLMVVCCSLLHYHAQAVVILQYHHVSDSTPKSTSVTPEQFAEQMQYLAENNFTVMPLTDAVDAIKNNTSIANNSIVITFDDGYQSIIQNAAPILASHNFPFTVFVSPAPIIAGYDGMMSWQDIKTLAEQGVTIANHSWGHEHLIRRLPKETTAQWHDRVENNILSTEAELLKQTGQSVKFLAYPYGEYTAALEAILVKHGFVGFGQQSGAAGEYSSITALPRFPVANAYADLSSLTVKFSSLPMPVVKQNISEPVLKTGQFRPKLVITLDTRDLYPHQLMCFIQGQGAKKPIWLSEDTFSIQAPADVTPGRSRYNCTVPSKTRTGYYWFSQMWIRPKDDGKWPQE